MSHVLRLSFLLFLSGFKGHISVNDCKNGDTLLDNFHVCVKRNLAEDSQNDELHQFQTVEKETSLVNILTVYCVQVVMTVAQKC